LATGLEQALIEEYLKPRGISQNRLAVSMSVTTSRVNEIVRGHRGITGDTGLCLSRVTGTIKLIELSLNPKQGWKKLCDQPSDLRAL
jgi:addiction module HigA family antidote